MSLEVNCRLYVLWLIAKNLQGLKGQAYVSDRVSTALETIRIGIRDEIARPDLLWTKDFVTQLLELVFAGIIAILDAKRFGDRAHGGSGNDETTLDERSFL